MSSHSKRLLTSFVVLPLLGLVIWKGGRTGFALVVCLAATVCLLEYYAFVLPRETMAVRAAGLTLGLVLAASFHLGGLGATPAVLIATFFGSAMICLARFNPQMPVVEMFYKQITGLVYIPFLLGHLILIRDWNNGVTWTFLIMAVIFAGDTAAYYAGHAFGRHKLALSISPGKTVEGAVAGLVANLLVGALFKKCCFPEFGWGCWIALIMVVGVLGQTGDLVESMLKRSVGLKDSGRILPGHGGFLDRIDALIFAAPVLYYFRIYLLS
jgi:phosphatidate cytidylyltransferase